MLKQQEDACRVADKGGVSYSVANGAYPRTTRPLRQDAEDGAVWRLQLGAASNRCRMVR
jgi:hypothetical protein